MAHEMEKAYEEGFAAGQQHQARITDNRAMKPAIEAVDVDRRGIAYGRPTFDHGANQRLAPPDMPPLQSQLRTTGVLLGALEEAVTQLESAANFVLQPEPPAAQGTDATRGDIRGLSAGVCAVEEVNKLLDRQLTRLRSIIRRLEV